MIGLSKILFALDKITDIIFFPIILLVKIIDKIAFGIHIIATNTIQAIGPIIFLIVLIMFIPIIAKDYETPIAFKILFILGIILIIGHLFS